MTQPILEKLAIAMRQAYADHTHDEIVPWSAAGKQQKAAWMVCARAALQALREHKCAPHQAWPRGDCLECTLPLAIDAILQEKA